MGFALFGAEMLIGNLLDSAESAMQIAKIRHFFAAFQMGFGIHFICWLLQYQNNTLLWFVYGGCGLVAIMSQKNMLFTGMFLQGIGLPVIRFHDLRATWATLMMSKGVEPIKVMIMGGWKELKTMQIYIRKAGVDIRGITDCLSFHDHNARSAKVLDFKPNNG
jgi:integrase